MSANGKCFSFSSTEEKKLMEREYARMPKQGVGLMNLVKSIKNQLHVPAMIANIAVVY